MLEPHFSGPHPDPQKLNGGKHAGSGDFRSNLADVQLSLSEHSLSEQEKVRQHCRGKIADLRMRTGR